MTRPDPKATAAPAQFAELGGVRIHYRVEGTGPTVVLVHAGIADLRMWDEVAAALRGRYRVVAYDLRGFGRSSMPEGFFSHTEDLHGLLDFLGRSEERRVGKE